ncbi:AAA family ATPase [Solirubrobacter taibaiensis]|nr:AAA family ATPase [Solirubrobacter taibaiensis]
MTSTAVTASDTTLTYSILGNVELHVGATTRHIGGPKQRALLAYLLVHANQVRTPSQLVEDVWGGEIVGVKAIPEAISRLRRLEVPVRWTGTGYQLVVDDETVDAQRFTARVRAGKGAFAAGRYKEAARLLRDADSLWRGDDALADVRHVTFAPEVIRRLEAERAEAFDVRVQAELELGLHDELIAVLEQRLTGAPTDERLGEHLMLAYYRSGHTDRALETYHRLRAALDEELGVRPGPGLEAMQVRVLDNSGSLALANVGVHERTWPMPLPPALAMTLDGEFVGRADARTTLRRAVEAAAAGRREVVWLRGDGGMGKTTLAARAAAYAREQCGCSVAYGAPAGEVTVPYSPWVGALSHFVRHAPYGPLKAHVTTHDAELARLIPALRDQLTLLREPRLSHPEAERALLFGAVVGWLQALCKAGPIVVVLDDLHWADPPSIALLGHVLAATADLPLLLLLSCRHTEVHAEHPLRRLLPDRPRPGVEDVALEGLEAADVAELISNADGRFAAAERIHRETGGNPFLVGELLRPLNDVDALWEPDLRPSERVRVFFERRVESMGADAVQTLGIAAVIGNTFDAALLEQLVRVDAAQMEDILDGAERRELIRSSAAGQYAFAHALIGSALYDSLSAGARLREHRRIAEALEPERVAEVAHHWYNADPLAPQTCRHAALAGEHALEQLAPEEAVKWFQRAHDACGGDEHERCERLIWLGEAQRRSDHKQFRGTLLEASRIARRLGDRDRLARAVLANTLGPLGAADRRDDERIAMLEEARPIVPEAKRPHVIAVLAKELYFGGEPRRGIELTEEALALARRHCDRTELARVMAQAVATSPIVPLSRHCELVGEVHDLAREIDDPELRFHSAVGGYMCGMHRGNREQLDASLAEMCHFDAQLREPLLHWHVLWARSAHATLAGDLEAGEALALEAEREEHGRSQRLIAFGQLVSVFTEQERLDELLERLEQLVLGHPDLPILKLARGYIDAEQGRLEPARAVLARAAALEFKFPYDRTRAFDLARCADIALRLGERGSAAALYTKLLDYRTYHATVNGISSRGSIELALGRLATLLERFEAADDHLATAAASHARLGAPLLQARTALAQAQSLAARGESVGEHVETALRLGATSAAIRREAKTLT